MSALSVSSWWATPKELAESDYKCIQTRKDSRGSRCPAAVCRNFSFFTCIVQLTRMQMHGHETRSPSILWHIFPGGKLSALFFALSPPTVKESILLIDKNLSRFPLSPLCRKQSYSFSFYDIHSHEPRIMKSKDWFFYAMQLSHSSLIVLFFSWLQAKTRCGI